MHQFIGKTLGPYQLTNHLGAGGFAEVYQGKHVQTGWDVAVKILNINYPEDSFRKEADLLWKLKHQHIVEIYTYDIETGTAYLVMEHAAKGSLRGIHPLGEVLPQPLICDYVKQIANALDYMHQKRLVHCDIKPPNFLVRANNEIILGDFGIATEAVSQSVRSMSPSSPQPAIAGTIHYIAPEQWLGHSPTHATDQYALAIVVYEWLCGRRPFSGTNSVIIAQAHIANPPPPFNDASISSDLEGVVMRALEKDPRDRYPSIMEFAQALENVIQNGPIVLQPSQQSTPHNQGAGLWGQLSQQGQQPTPNSPHQGAGLWGQLNQQGQQSTPNSPHQGAGLWGQLNQQGQQPTPNSPHQGAGLWGQFNQQGQQPIIRGPNEDPDPTIAIGNGQFQQGGQSGYQQNAKKRKIRRLDWGQLREPNNQIFLLLGGVADLLGGIIWLFISHGDLNVAIVIFLLSLTIRVLCVVAIKPNLACPLAWFLAIFETFTFTALLIYLNSNLYMLVVIVLFLAWFLNEFLYARKK